MVTSDLTSKDLLNTKTTYTLGEAIEYVKIRNKFPTPTHKPSVSWSCAKTGKRVTFGVSG